MQVADRKISMRADGFLPRYNAIECFHRHGNHLFGIKFRISPVIFKKKINFSEYREYIYSLSYLLEQTIIDSVKNTGSFEERISILSNYFLSELGRYEGSWQPVNMVSQILEQSFQENRFTVPVDEIAQQYRISARTLQRYFEMCTGISTNQALQIMRIRKATAHLVNSPGDFDHTLYGYYDHSHFYKHLRQFLQKNTLKNIQPHLRLLSLIHKN